MSREAFRALADEMVDTTFRLDPVTATLNGIHDYDSELGDPSAGAARRRIEWYREMERRLEAEVDEADLSAADRIDHAYLVSRLRAGILIWDTQREAERSPFLYPDTCLYGAFLLYAREFAPLSERLPPLLERLSRTRAYLAEARRTIRNPPAIFAEIAIEVAAAGLEFVEEIRGNLVAAVPDRRKAVETACEEARIGFQEFRDWIRDEVLPGAQAPFAIGRETFDARLRDEHLLPYDTDSLEAVGWKIMRETQEKMARLAETISPGTPWQALIDRTKSDHPTSEGLLEAYRVEMRRVRSFVVEKRLAPLPDGEELEVIETPAFDRSRTPYAAYLMPGPFDRNQKGFFFVTPVDLAASAEDREQQLRGHNLHSLPLVSLHEAYPGHHLQLCWANRSRSRLRKLADSSVLAEGWALYCEELMYEQGYYGDPRVRLYQLKDLCWRAARVVLDCRLHSGSMSVEEAVDFLVKEPMLERPNAVAEVKRYTTSPTQPMSYLIGKTVLLDLRAEVRERLGDRFELHDFHAAVLQAGTLPVPLVCREVRTRFGLNGG